MSSTTSSLRGYAVVIFWLVRAGVQGASSLPQVPSELFRLDRVWDVGLDFARDQWRALQPVDPENTGNFGGESESGGRRGLFPAGPESLLGSVTFRAADVNADGKVTAEEFKKLSEQWYEKWDIDHLGRIDEPKFQTALTTELNRNSSGPTRFGLQNREGRRAGLSGARGLEFNYVHADFTLEGQAFPEVAVRYKGNDTYLQSVRQLKRPLKVDFNEFTKGQRLAGITKINLHNNVADSSWMNEALAYQLYRDAGVPAPRVGYARVRLSVPNVHTNTLLGLYTLVENIDANFAEENFGTKKGLLLKPSTGQLFKYLGEDWEQYKQTYDPKTPVYVSQAKRVIAFAKLLSEAEDSAFAAAAADYVDFDEVSRFLAVTVWISTLDSILGMGQNFVIYLHPQTQKLQLLPWDLDHAFGHLESSGSQEEREQLSIREAWNPQVRFLTRLMAIPAFEAAYLARLQEFQSTLFRPTRLNLQVDALAAVIRDSVKLEGAEKLARFDLAVSGEAPGTIGPFSGAGAPPTLEATPSPTPTKPVGERTGIGARPDAKATPAKPIKGFVGLRYASVAAQLEGRSQGKKLAPQDVSNPVGVLAAQLFARLDENHDQILTRPEFVRRFQTWFSQWDTTHWGWLDEAAIRKGWAEILSPHEEP